MGFQGSVNVQPAPAFEGDWASTNPRVTHIAGPGGLIAGPEGLIVGRFAWIDNLYVDPDNAPMVARNYGVGAPAGYIHREQQGLITDYLAESGLGIPKGFPVTLVTDGDLWVRNNNPSVKALVGMKLFAEYGTGKTFFAAAGGAPVTAASASAGTLAAVQSTFTGKINGNILTVTAGSPIVGAVLSGTGGNAIATGTRILEQLSGTPGGVGTYAVSIPDQEVTSTTITQDYGLFTAAGTIAGEFKIGQVLSGAGGGNAVTTGTKIYAFGTGTGGLGTYIVDKPTGGDTTASAISAAGAYETKWRAISQGAAGELVKVTSNPAI
jgi:hypothetical protein